VRVAHLSLRSWRNYREAEAELGPGATLLVGPNGQGKTNLVEAIGYLATGSSHRVADDAALVRQGDEAAIVRARLEHAGRAVVVELQLNRRGANRAQLGGTPIKTRELPRHVAAVQFAPEDLALVRGEPSGRRRLLDELLVQRQPRFAGVLSDYDRALRQRNTLLKSARASRLPAGQLTTLDVWDDRLVSLGAELIAARSELVAALAVPVAQAYQAVAGAEHAVELAPRLSVLGAQPEEEAAADDRDASAVLDRDQAEEAFRAALVAQRRAELERGLTLVGPHRDDLLLGLNGMPARGYASHGESWSYALALRLGAARLLRTESPLGDPVLILDDVFAELDERRRARLAEAVSDFEQLLITAAVESDVPEGLAGSRLRIRAGAIEAAG